MKVAFATKGEGGIDDVVSDKFGRCPTFTVVEVENGEVKSVRVLRNPGSGASSGAGIKAVQAIVNAGVEMVVVGSIGPNATAAIREVGIKHVSLSGKVVKDALKEVLGIA